MKEPIITLDGEMWDRNELTQKAIQDSFYYGYLAKACLSSSAISQLLKSPLVESSIANCHLDNGILYS